MLTDIIGAEDHLGDMDFKVAGTTAGITALQMDIKITGINHEIMGTALDQAEEGRLLILGIMNQAISAPRTRCRTSPRASSAKDRSAEHSADVIGKGGSTIRALTEETGCTIDIEDDGTVKVASADGAGGRGASAHRADHRRRPRSG